MKKNKQIGIFRRQFTSILQETKLVSEIEDPELKEYLEGFYAETDKDIVIYGSLINSIFTHYAKTFLLSKRTLFYMVENDPNITQDIKIHYTSYKRFLYRAMSAGFIVRVKEATNKKAGVYKLVEEDACKKLNELQGLEFFKEQEDFVLNIYGKTEEVEPLPRKTFADKLKEVELQKRSVQ